MAQRFAPWPALPPAPPNPYDPGYGTSWMPMYDWNYNIDAYALYDRGTNPVFLDRNVKPDVAFPATMTFPDWYWLWYTTVDGLITCWAIKPTEVPPPPQTIQAKFFTLPAGRTGLKPSDYAGEDLHGTITVDGSPHTTPVTLQLTVGATVNLSAPGAVDWDYYGVGHVHSPEASYTVVATATEFAAFYEAAPPPPPPTSPIGVLVAVAGAALLLALGGIAIYQQLR